MSSQRELDEVELRRSAGSRRHRPAEARHPCGSKSCHLVELDALRGEGRQQNCIEIVAERRRQWWKRVDGGGRDRSFGVAQELKLLLDRGACRVRCGDGVGELDEFVRPTACTRSAHARERPHRGGGGSRRRSPSPLAARRNARRGEQRRQGRRSSHRCLPRSRHGWRRGRRATPRAERETRRDQSRSVCMASRTRSSRCFSTKGTAVVGSIWLRLVSARSVALSGRDLVVSCRTLRTSGINSKTLNGAACFPSTRS